MFNHRVLARVYRLILGIAPIVAVPSLTIGFIVLIVGVLRRRKAK